jgi:hypothetical protein
MITRENLITLLQASGRDIAQCEGTCAVDTARLIGADYVGAGDFSRVGPSVKLTLTCRHLCRQGVPGDCPANETCQAGQAGAAPCASNNICECR